MERRGLAQGPAPMRAFRGTQLTCLSPEGSTLAYKIVLNNPVRVVATAAEGRGRGVR